MSRHARADFFFVTASFENGIDARPDEPEKPEKKSEKKPEKKPDRAIRVLYLTNEDCYPKALWDARA
jgi:hypothetical protein